MKKQEREEICVVSSNTENISHWAWGCGYVSTAGSSGLPQVSGTSHWILLTTIPAILWYWGQCFPVLKDLPLPRVWAPRSKYASEVIAAVTWGSCSAFLWRLPWHPTIRAGHRSCSISPGAAHPPGCQDCSWARSQHAEGCLKQGLWDKPLLSIKCHRIFNAHAEQAAVTQRTFSTLKLHGNYLPLKLCLAYRDSNI